MAALALLACNAACATGGLFEAGRLREQVLRFRSAGLDEGRLVLVYDACEARVARPTCPDGPVRLRVVAIPLEELLARPPTPVDRFTIDRLRNDARQTQEHVAMIWEQRSGAAARGLWALHILEGSDGTHGGFTLSPPGGVEVQGRLDSVALLRERSAWWVWPLLPAALAIDAVTLPPLMVLALPFFTVGD